MDIPQMIMPDILGNMQQMAMNSVTVTVTFEMKGHKISVSGMNPEYVIKGVEGMKKATKELTEVKTGGRK